MALLYPFWTTIAPSVTASFPENGVGPLVSGARYVYIVAPLIDGLNIIFNRGKGAQTSPTSITQAWTDVYRLFPYPLNEGEYVAVENTSLATASVLVTYHVLPDVVAIR